MREPERIHQAVAAAEGVCMTTESTADVRRILVIDDDAEIHSDFRKVLLPPGRSTSVPPRFALDAALHAPEGVALARRAREAGAPYHVVFVDLDATPGAAGTRTIEELWKVDRELQIVMCTARSDHSLELLSERFGHGGNWLLSRKPIQSTEILQLAATLSEKWKAERRVEAKVAELEHHLLHDRLTGLPNRALLTQRLEQCILHHQRDPARRYALLFLDCDGFKLINDSLGHEAGDQMLVELANRLRESLRATDLVCHSPVPSRVGGDEFLVLLEDLRAVSDSALVAERLLDVLSRPHEAGGHRLSVTVSIGIATCERSYPNATEVIRDADTAMYRVKSEGGGSYAMFDLAMHAAVNERLVLVSRLRDAVRANDIALHYQPVVRLADGRLVGFEALARWNHPELGQVPPAQFIAIAEETGLIQTLGAQMLRKACVQLALWRKRHPEAIRGIRMSVNVSRKQLTTTDLAACVGDTLQETGVEANALALEVTEGLVMDDLDGAVAALNRLRKIGLELHMDDFGTGYTSLIHLYRLPMAAIKIDRAFIVHAAAEPSHQRVLEAIMNIAKAFHLTVVGEGIETVEQFELLRRLGVELGQGYFFGRPVPAEQAERVLLSGLSLVPTSV